MESDKQRDRQTDRQNDKHTDERPANAYRQAPTNRKEKSGQADRQIGRHTCSERGPLTNCAERKKDLIWRRKLTMITNTTQPKENGGRLAEIDIQTDRQTNRLTNRQTDRQKDG